MSVTNTFKPSIWVLLITILGSSGAYAFSVSLPGTGIRPSGFPNFTFGSLTEFPLDEVELEKKKYGYKLEAENDHEVDFIVNISPGNSVMGTDGEFELEAKFDNSGMLVVGEKSKLKIEGAIPAFPGFPGIPETTLLTARLTAFAFGTDPSSGLTLLGFNTTDIWCAPGLLALFTCTTDESVYIILDPSGDAFPGITGLMEDEWESRGASITTVPLPAAAWLFLSGFGLLVWLRRRSLKAV